MTAVVPVPFWRGLLIFFYLQIYLSYVYQRIYLALVNCATPFFVALLASINLHNPYSLIHIYELSYENIWNIARWL